MLKFGFVYVPKGSLSIGEIKFSGKVARGGGSAFP